MMFTSSSSSAGYKAGFGCLDGSGSNGGTIAFGRCHCPPGSRAISLQCNRKLRVSDK